MKTASITAIIVIILAGIGGFVLYQQQAPQTADQATTTDPVLAEAPADWIQHQDNFLSFAHPTNAEISQEAGRTKIQILGPNNEENTEVTDGITAYLSATSAAGISQEALTERVFADKRQTSQEVIEQPTSTQFAGRSGFWFTLRNQLGSETRTIVIPADKTQTALIGSYTASGQDTQQYIEQFETIMETTELTALPAQDNIADQPEQATTSTSTSQTGGSELAQLCEQADGHWLAKHNECENVTESWCEKQGGSFNACASACRHDPDAQMCTQQCVFVCSL
jgi:hypothetical protein